MLSSIETPRLTTYLRAYSTLSHSDQNVTNINYYEGIQEKSRFSERQVRQKRLNWDKFIDKMMEPFKKDKKNKNQSEMKSLLDRFKLNTRQFISEDVDSETVKDTALYLFEAFYNKLTKDYIKDDMYLQLKPKFPSANKNLIEKTFTVVEEVINLLPDSKLISQVLAKKNEVETEGGHMFGDKIEYINPNEYFCSTVKYPFDFTLDEIFGNQTQAQNTQIKFEFPTKAVEPKKEVVKVDQESNDLKLLYWADEFDPEVSRIVVEMLSSKKSNDELQNDILDVIGFEKLEIIEFFLNERSKIVDSYKRFYDESGKPRIKQSASKGRGNKQQSNSTAAALSSDIIIHTETEKKLKKIMRKEEKKINKMLKDNEDVIEGVQFDPNELRQIREEQLAEAHMLHLYNMRNTTVVPQKVDRNRYPFVFDKFSEAKKNSAFIAGSKILLPENITRYDDQIYEQIYIPTTNIEEDKDMKVELVPTEELDDIGKIAFRNVKYLNRIQSVVFNAVYNSNQNLLICAPTGAGKTNIAMLAVVNEIKKNFDNGVLKKENFKIVYIAPMKALAAEMADNFQRRLEPLGITVKELTGDMQLTKTEITQTQILVTTPEKWDVVTRKSQGDISLSLLVRLLIIDEVHLLQDDRGSVIETIVARTLRQVETSQKMIRIIGLSATLPNYVDVARFLDVDPYSGLFFFDGRFRPVPLTQTFIGTKGTTKMAQLERMDDVCYEKCLKLVKAGHQVMVFVHARNATIKTALKLRDKAKFEGDIQFFLAEQSKAYGETQKKFSQSRNKQLREIFDDGFGVHHAGMLRQDRSLVEKAFLDGHIRVLVCTATLAWGVNLPAHAVIIKGTEVYDSNKGSFVDLSILDVLQIFGRAGRPQYDKSGEAFIITSHDKLALYLSLLTTQSPIESQFIQSLADNLNAEVCLGTVSTIDEGAKWLSYTYLHVRMKYNPLVYGITYKTLEDDPGLCEHRAELIKIAARNLDKAKMVRYDEKTGYLFATDLGRTASHYYINYDTIEMINERLRMDMNEKDILAMISSCTEFQQLKVRDEEMEELDYLHGECPLAIKEGIENTNGKVNLLIQAYISRLRLEGFSLVSDMSYVSQNVNRIARALFEIVLKLGWSLMSGRLLNICKVLERQLWHFQHPMRQFDYALTFDILSKMEEKKISMERLREMDVKEIGLILHHQKMAEKVKEYASYMPVLEAETTIHPITRSVIRIRLSIASSFRWNDKIHGQAENFWIWIEDPSSNQIYHHEYFSLQKKYVKSREAQLLVFTIPIFEPLPSQYLVRMISDRWLGCEFTHAITFKHLILPERHPPHTELLDLDPLPLQALNNTEYEKLYNFTHFNPIQTQLFHCLYHTDSNALVGCPTGSGKTIMAELAILRVFNKSPTKKIVYIAPLKALVRERMIDWKERLENRLGKKVVELTGDVVPDMRLVTQADVIVTTPEKWDGISRSWQTRTYVKEVALIVIDEIHLLGEDRGPVLEVIVSRTNFISSHTSYAVRIIGLSTALANARDLADWLGIRQMGLYNFKPSVRPVPLEAHIKGFPGKHYCPRMATMNKPCFKEIKTHSPDKPVLIFVSSRRQTRLTAIDLISFLATEANPKQWLNITEIEISSIIDHVHDTNLKLTLAFGIGLHHAGLNDGDRRIVEELFVNRKIQILIATSTLAWGVNFPAHLVIIKGTEYYDGKTKRYVDYPITDVLQMMGRAGRPQFDDQGKAVIMVQDVKKHFYKKFLYEPFPVESCLLNVLPDHINAEIVAGTITSKQEAIDYLTWTYFFRRLLVNPTYYQLEELENHQVNKYLSKLVQDTINTLVYSNCVLIDEEGKLDATTSGRIASFYYLTHKTLLMFKDKISPESDIESLIDILSSAEEYAELPVRHNEDKINADLSNDVPIKVNPYSFDNPHTKCHLLLQAYYSQIELPSSDYNTDLKTVMDQCMRILQAMLDVSADQGWLVSSVYTVHLMQMTCMGRWLTDSDLLNLPHIGTEHLSLFINYNPRIDCLPRLINIFDRDKNLLEKLFGDSLSQSKINDIRDVILRLPQISIELSISGNLPSKNEKVVINDNEVVELYADEDYTLILNLKRLNKLKSKDSKAYTPKLSKPKDENWIVILGDYENKELLALKRVSHVKYEQNVNLHFISPPYSTGIFTYDLFYMSDVYIGLDQQYQIKFKIVKK